MPSLVLWEFLSGTHFGPNYLYPSRNVLCILQFLVVCPFYLYQMKISNCRCVKIASVVRSTCNLSGGKLHTLSRSQAFINCHLEEIGLDEFVQNFLQIQHWLGLAQMKEMWVSQLCGQKEDLGP